VCGSIDHPNPAHYAENAVKINQQAVDDARELQAKQFKVVDGIKGVVQGALHSVTDKENEVKQLEKNLADNANKSVDKIAASYQTLEKELKQIETKETQLHKTKIQKDNKENESVPISNQIKEIEAQIPELTTRKATAKSELDSVNKTLPEVFRSPEAIKQELNQIGKKITDIEFKYTAANKEQIDSLTNQSSVQSKLNALNEGLDELNLRQKSQSQLWEKALINSDFVSQDDFVSAQLANDELEVIRNKVILHEDSIKALQAELGLLGKQLKDKQLPDLEKLQQSYDEVKDVFILAEQTWTDANQQLKKLSDTQKKIEQIEKQQTEIKKQYEIVGTLSKAASGRGNVRVSLERFVLGNILDQVLSIASDRLHIMSKGQYRLIRQNEEDQKRNTTAGLDLAIDDAYTGKTRPVATLSGGESFLASLALALGLSDVVQERSGGIQLDTLFIDEGFGSLDQDSLQLAINTLIDLQSTGRTIGIISHVSELKEQMAQRIEVIGSRGGSVIKMVA
jgi:exonuclease SbcC